MRFTRHAVLRTTLLAVAAAATTGALAQPSSAAAGDILVNAGGAAYQDGTGQVYSADKGFVGGWTYSTTRRIDRTDMQPLFQSERTGLTGYDLPVSSAGTYRVTLGFAELYWSAAGKRVFDVSAEGTRIIAGLDIHAVAGKYRAMTRTVDVPVTDGSLTLRFTARVDQPTVSVVSAVPLTQVAPAPVTSAAPSPSSSPSPTASPSPSATTTTSPSPSPTTTTAPATSAPACTSTMAAGGSIGTFINGLAPGAVGCLPGGTYTGANVEMAKSGTSSSRITVQSVPGQTAKLAMRLSIVSDYVTFRGLNFDTDHQLGTSNTWVKSTANDVTFEANEFADSGLAGTVAHDGQCLYSDAGSYNIRIVRNYFHDCGSMDHFHHSMYLNGRAYTIANNLVLRTKAWGIHLYPDLDDSLVSHNTVDGSGRAGIIMAESSTGNRVANNIVTNNAQGGIDGYAVAGPNTVEDNLCFANGSFCVEAGNGFVGTGNVTADPGYLNRTGGDFHVGSSSPAVGTADMAFLAGPDKDGVSRPQGGAPDKGAYER